MRREVLLLRTFVALADTLVDTYDVIDFTQTLAERCVELLDVSAAGIMLADADGKLRHVACSSEQMRLVELFEVQLEEGPCFDAFSEQVAVTCDSLEEASKRWPRFAPYARASGFEAVSAAPMRLRSKAIGSLNLFSSDGAALHDDELEVAQAMADIATIGILHEREMRDSDALSAQLEGALESRIVIEQAKGVVAERDRVSVDEAFVRIRQFARRRNRFLSDTARQIVAGTAPSEAFGHLRPGSGSAPEPS